MQIDKDAFSSGQIGSKLWLCEELENLNWRSIVTHVYGGWIGVLPFLLLSRGKFVVDRIESYDIDPTCQLVADAINENWVWQNWKFKARTADCNTLISRHADLIINTSTEHFESLLWFNNIASGTRVILQGNNMKHADHVVYTETLEDFKKEYNLSEIVYEGTKEFNYPTWNFTRFMIIGVK